MFRSICVIFRESYPPSLRKKNDFYNFSKVEDEADASKYVELLTIYKILVRYICCAFVVLGSWLFVTAASCLIIAVRKCGSVDKIGRRPPQFWVSRSHTHCLTLTHTHTHCHNTHSPYHTHILTHTQTFSHTHIHSSLFLSLSYTLTFTRAHSHTHSLTRAHTQVHSHSHTHSHTHTHTHTRKQASGKTRLNEWSARRRGQYLHQTRQTLETNIHTLSGIRTRDPRIQAASGPRLRPHGHQDLPIH